VGVDQANPPCSRIGPSPRPDDPATTFVSEGIEEGVADCRCGGPGRKDVVLFGATVPRLALAHGLVDEILRSGR
jgi:hypothetical protein